MKVRIVLLVVLVLALGLAFGGGLLSLAQGQCQSWDKVLDLPTSPYYINPYYFRSCQPTQDGGYLLLGTKALFKPGEYYYDAVLLIKLDAQGNTEWDKTFIPTHIKDGEEEYLSSGSFSIQQTEDGGYIVLGYVDHGNPSVDEVWLIKTDAHGNKLWDKTFDGGWGCSIQQTSDGGYILLGYTGSYGAGDYHYGDLWLVKTDDQGNVEWDRTFNKRADWHDVYWGKLPLRQTGDGGYIFLAPHWLIKTDAQGNSEWEREVGLDISDVQCTEDGGYVLLMHSGGGLNEFAYLEKRDGQGNVQWSKRIRVPYTPVWALLVAMQQTPDGGYIMLGGITTYLYRYPNYGDYEYKQDVWLVKTDARGNTQWEKTFDKDNNDFGLFLQIASDGGYLLFCRTEPEPNFASSRWWLIKYCP